MIVAMLETASEDQIQDVTDHLMRMGFAVHRTTGARQSVLAAVGRRIDFDTRDLEVLSGVDLDETSLVIQWSESGGPEVREPQHKGFGLNLLSKILRDAKVELRFKPTGLTCSILVNIS